MTVTVDKTAGGEQGAKLERSIGFWGLTFVSLGSIIGSGWLLGALGAATTAGPASLVSWALAAFLLTTLALVHAELGTSYPVAGGTSRFPYFAFGAMAGFTAGWTSWLQAVAVAPGEVEASLTYLNSVHWVNENMNMLKSNGQLNGLGLAIASVFMLLFTWLNLIGAKFLSESNTLMVIWKFFVPVLTIIVLMVLSFHTSNFHAGGGFAPHGVHGIFAALPLGVVFALQGFEQAVQMAGEAKDPQRHLAKAIMLAMGLGVVIYIMLEVCFIGALKPANLVQGWDNPLGHVGDYGVYYTLALGLGAGWLATILIVDAVVSPAGTGLVYVGATARLSYALGKEEVLPDQLTKTTKRGVPIYSVLLAFVIGEVFFLPFPSWQKIVAILTGATATMYAFGPVSLGALRRRDPERARPYKVPFPSVLIPASFAAANLIIYWSGFEVMWKLLALIFVGRVLFEIAIRRADVNRTDVDWRATSWIWPWLIGMTVIGVLGRYGGNNTLPEWVDLVIVVAFSIGIYYYAVTSAMSESQVQDALSSEEWLLPSTDEKTMLRSPGAQRAGSADTTTAGDD